MNFVRLVSAVYIFCFAFPASGFATQFFVAANGSNSNPGTIDQPYLSLSKAVSLSTTVFKPGDTVFVRGGVYTENSTITISKIGTAQAPYHIYAYPGERPVLDFSSMAYSSSNIGISLKGSFVQIRGLDIKGAGDNGMHISGSDNQIEFCSFYDNRDSGLQLSGGASNNKIINCDSYFNADPDNYGDADGFAVKMDVGSGNYFYGCRAWLNVDDGWDGYLRGADNVTTASENCWAFKNGYLKNGVDGGASANGNGFKMGGSDDKLLIHNFTLTNCLAFMNKAKGFDQNNNKGSMTLYNCTGYSNNGQNYSISSALAAGKIVTLKNCAELGAKVSLLSSSIQITNSWMLNPLASAGDFLNIDTSSFGQATAPRKADGSLPDISFMHLSASSRLIDAGTEIGLPFSGKAPDMGCFETSNTSGLPGQDDNAAMNFQLLQNYPNPFNPVTKLIYKLSNPGRVSLKVYNIQGREVATLADGFQAPGLYNISWDASRLSSGVYICKLIASDNAAVRKMILVK